MLLQEVKKIYRNVNYHEPCRQVKRHMTLVRESLGEDIWRLTNSSLILHQVDSPSQKLVKRGNIWGLTNSSLILHQVDSTAQKLVKRGNLGGLTNSSLILHQVDSPAQKLAKRRNNSSFILHQVDSPAQKLVKRGNIWGLTNSSLILQQSGDLPTLPSYSSRYTVHCSTKKLQ